MFPPHPWLCSSSSTTAMAATCLLLFAPRHDGTQAVGNREHLVMTHHLSLTPGVPCKLLKHLKLALTSPRPAYGSPYTFASLSPGLFDSSSSLFPSSHNFSFSSSLICSPSLSLSWSRPLRSHMLPYTLSRGLALSDALSSPLPCVSSSSPVPSRTARSVTASAVASMS